MAVLLIASPDGPFGRWPLVGLCDRHRLGIGYGGHCHCSDQCTYFIIQSTWLLEYRTSEPMAPKSKKEQQKVTVVVEESEASAPRQGTQLPNDEFVEKLTELIHNGTLGETLNVAYERVHID